MRHQVQICGVRINYIIATSATGLLHLIDDHPEKAQG